MSDIHTPQLLKHLRQMCTIEGLSALLLFMVAMPLKYLLGWPVMVKYVGWVHGVLFLYFIGLLLVCWVQYRLKFYQVFLLGLGSLLPFGFMLYSFTGLPQSKKSVVG